MNNLHPILSQVMARICVIPVDAVTVTGSDTETCFEAAQQDAAHVYVKAFVKTPLQEFEGSCGISNTSLLQGLLNFASYADDKATIHVQTRTVADNTYPAKIIFKDVNKQGAEFILMNPLMLPKRLKMKGEIQTDITMIPDQSKITEFNNLSKLYSDMHKVFRLNTVDGKLIANLGDSPTDETTGNVHTASVCIAESVEGSFNSNQLLWPIKEFFSILKPNMNDKITIQLSTKMRCMVISVDTDIAHYMYIVRCKQSE
jgi:hypothetical protein